jgi:hypothetical protein
MPTGKWYDEDWPFRLAAYVRNTTVTTTFDIIIPITELSAHFWENVQADLDDVRVTSAYGVLLTYDIASLDYANRSVVVEVDDFDAEVGEKCNLIWLYYGNAAATAANTSFVTSSPKIGGAASFVNPLEAQFVHVAARAQADQTRPLDTVVKTSTEEMVVYVDVTDWLADGSYPIEGSMGLEGVLYATLDIQQAGVTVSSMYDSVQSIYPVEHAGRIYLGVHVQAGTHDNDYTGILKLTTTAGNTYEHRFLIKVYDVSEA